MKHHLTYFLNKTKIFNKQFYFRPGLSIFCAVSTCTSDLYAALNENKYIISILIDINDAFDTLQPDIIPHKVYHYGVR